MKLKQLVVMMIAAVFFVTTVASIANAAYLGKVDEKTRAERAKKRELQREENKGKPVPGFQQATPQQQQEIAKENMKRKLAEEQKKKDEAAKKALLEKQKEDAEKRGATTGLKEYKK
ncbi:MAG TPA: hypothetical protein PLX02_07055 [Syntrophorhabdaceae bacterium]|nr:hypothetical protein [Syntrophorhabdaceae bacterium]HQM81365.1 hypothetical protein [Syntrophorhabdaceae bacterium]